MEKAAELVAKAGFTQLDYTPALKNDDWEEKMKKAVKIFDSFGLAVHQTHAPFNRYGRHGVFHKTYLDRCAQATQYMGAKYMVAHGRMSEELVEGFIDLTYKAVHNIWNR